MNIEREALLKLWNRIPETKPSCIIVMNTTSGKQLWRGNPNVSESASRWSDLEVAALARDAIVEWLQGFGVVKTSRSSDGESVTHYVSLSRVNHRKTSATNFYRNKASPTRLLALIAAANAVADNA